MKQTITVDLFWASSCNRCQQAKIEINKAIQRLDHQRFCYRELDVVEEIDYAVKLGVLKTPSLAINGHVVFSSLPSSKDLIATLEKALDESL